MTSATAHHGPVDYQEVQARPEFSELRRTHRSFVFPMTVFFLIWYLAYVLFAAFQPDLMAMSVLGNINLGIVLGLSQFVTTFVITGLYVSFTNKKLDPKSSVIRRDLEAAGVGLPPEDETPTPTDSSKEEAR